MHGELLPLQLGVDTVLNRVDLILQLRGVVLVRRVQFRNPQFGLNLLALGLFLHLGNLDAGRNFRLFGNQK